MLKALIRDNTVINPLIRTGLRFLVGYSDKFLRLTQFYRIFGQVTLRVQGITFKVYSRADDHIANDIYYNNGYEAEEFALVKSLIASANTFVDVGANTGIFSIFAAKAKSSVKVLSFEPSPQNYDRLLKNIQINDLKNISSYPYALGPSEGTIAFTIPADNSLSTTASANEAFATHFHGIPQRHVEVRQTTLDSILLPLGLLSNDLLKIDVEYYELEVLKGAFRMLGEVRPRVLIEILDYNTLIAKAPSMRGKIDENHAQHIERFLKAQGYFSYSLSRSGIAYADSVLTRHDHRNFLFLPKKLPNIYYTFEELNSLVD